jgi:tripartite ATP-independent transporter DctP family solute receptor
MRIKNIFAGLIASFILGAPLSGNAADVTLKLGHNAAPDHVYHAMALKFKDAVEKRSNGAIEIKIFPADQLGSQRQLVEGAQLGTTDMVITSDSMLSNFIDTFQVLNLPFIFRDYDHMAKVMDGPIGDGLRKDADKKGIVVLGYWENGFRAISNSKHPINKADDLKGLKLRTSPGKLAVATFQAFGALATPMATGEVYSALQLGTIDGQENSAGFVLSQKYYEVQKYLSITKHQHNVEPLIISKMVYMGLKPEYQQILREEADRLAPEARRMVMEKEDKIIAELKTKIAVNEASDPDSFVRVAASIYKDYEAKYGDMIKAIAETK